MNFSINTIPFDPENCISLWNKEINEKLLFVSHFRPKEVLAIDRWKRAFGRQLKTWVGGSDRYRFYVWSFQYEDAVLYALIHNRKGEIFEYPIETSISKILPLANEVIDKLLGSYRII
jgi:hypothetical protein